MVVDFSQKKKQPKQYLTTYYDSQPTSGFLLIDVQTNG